MKKILIITLLILVILYIVSIILRKARRDKNQMALDTNANVRAFLLMIRVGEGTAGSNGYRTLFGGTLFNDLSKHPRKVFSTKWGNTSAAGAYQILAKVPGKVKTDTWDWVSARLGLTDFSPLSQDLAAIELLRHRKVYDLVEKGRIEEAINGWDGKTGANKEWASLPNSPYGQPMKTMAQALNYYQQYGGTIA